MPCRQCGAAPTSNDVVALAVTVWLGLLALASGIFSIVAGIVVKRRAGQIDAAVQG